MIMKRDFILLLIYLMEAAVFGIVALIVKKRRSKFPDLRVGYHVETAQADEKSWEYANETAGKICILAAVLLLTAGIFCYKMGTGFNIMFNLLLIISGAAVGSVLFLPAYLLRRPDQQKKVEKIMRRSLIGILVFLVLWMLWLYAYYHAKNTDSLPALESLQAEDLQELEGYKRVQLVTVWDEPDEKVSSEQEVWVLDEKRVLLVMYDKDGTVKGADIQQASKNQNDTD